ncbi:hypothetical protein HDE76_001480 [Rhodanobacter sp. ANJX3]|uniref:RipA family octameric membrane protein n=1 Tax=Rhodanobacter sp. ANJX3 TaxID=2723083 RepID=UPI0016208FC1|nr:hypothetical protein [Rhodanobacter sp. ANJX3]MBB5358274.1 hypothetical protein [Rhodanobacter sp. ANJX3]
MIHTDSYRDYVEAFGIPGTPEGAYLKDSRLAKAYEVALDIRKFEIDLYWKRSGSFWLLVGGIAASLGLALGAKSGVVFSRAALEIVCLFISLLGCFVCVAWVLVNRGSKFWQRNWELQVQILEDRVIGPLYKSVFAERDVKVMYSVTRINECIAVAFALMFAASTFVFIIGSSGFAYLKCFLDNVGFWPVGDDMAITMVLAKLAIGLVALALARRALSRAINDRVTMVGKNKQDWNHDLDMEVEVSVRAIKLVERCSSKAADFHWKKPESGSNEVKRSSVSFFKTLSYLFKSSVRLEDDPRSS